MRLLHAISSLDPHHGGPPEFIRQVNRCLASDSHGVEVLCLDRPDAPFVGSCPFPVHALGPAMGKYRYTRRLQPWLEKHASRFDAVIVHGLWQHVGVSAMRALRGRSPYFVITHGMLDPWCVNNGAWHAIKKRVYWWMIENRVLREARAVLFSCEEERLRSRQSLRPYNVREFVVVHGTSFPPGDPEAQRERFFEKYPQLRDKEILLYLGRMDRKKGLDMLFAAFGEIASARPDLHLVIAGPEDPRWRRELEQIAAPVAPRVTWCGMLPEELKWGALRAAGAFILPSHQENFGLAVVEALACGTPVLISNQVNIWREILDGGGGLIESDDLAGTRRLIQRWVDMPAPERSEMRIKAQECYRAKFDVAATARNVIAMLGEFGVNGNEGRQ